MVKSNGGICIVIAVVRPILFENTLNLKQKQVQKHDDTACEHFCFAFSFLIRTFYVSNVKLGILFVNGKIIFFIFPMLRKGQKEEEEKKQITCHYIQLNYHIKLSMEIA